jgi:hypothetical protein
MVTPTRTIGPLHLEDLEPRRFEDMIRQLVYDFRTWRMLEATGRSGSDDGFDARGFEIVAGDEAPRESGEEEDADELPAALNDRIWLVQCKREKAPQPKTLQKYLDGVAEEERKQLYGMIFAAACDFSKSARDAFRAKTRAFGLAEAYLWGKGELRTCSFNRRMTTPFSRTSASRYKRGGAP